MKNTRTKQTPIQRAMKIVTSITLLAMLFVLVLAGTLSGAFGVEENLVQNGKIEGNVASAADVRPFQTIDLSGTFKNTTDTSININPDVAKRGGLYTTKENHLTNSKWETGNATTGGKWYIADNTNHSGSDYVCAWFVFDLGADYASRVYGDLNISLIGTYTNWNGGGVFAIESGNNLIELPTTTSDGDSTWYSRVRDGNFGVGAKYTKTDELKPKNDKKTEFPISLTHTVSGRYVRIHYATYDPSWNYNEHRLDNVKVTLSRTLAYYVDYDKNSTTATGTVVKSDKLEYFVNNTISNDVYIGNKYYFDHWNTKADNTGVDMAVGAATGTNTNSGFGKVVKDNLQAGITTTTLYAQWNSISFVFNRQPYSIYNGEVLQVLQGHSDYLSSTVSSNYTSTITYKTSSGTSLSSAPTEVGNYIATITVSKGSQIRGSVDLPFAVIEGDFGKFPSGTSGKWGSETNPYVISTTIHLENLSGIVNGTQIALNTIVGSDGGAVTADDVVATDNTYANCYFVVTANITVSSSFERIAKDNSHYFKGNFNGQNHTIGGLNCGLFGYVSGGGTFKDLTLQGSVTSNTSDYYGGLIGYATNITVSGVTNEIVLATSNSYVGGLIGFCQNATIENCHNNAKVSGIGNVGGIVGFTGDTKKVGFGSYITNCTNSGDILATGDYVGGIVGWARDTYFTDVVNSGDIKTSGNTVGGISSRVCGGSVNNAQNSGNVEGTDFVGGITGHLSWATITNVSNSGKIIGNDYVGGLVGQGESNQAIDFLVNGTLSNTGCVGGRNYVGGIAGYLKNTTDKNVSIEWDATVYIENCTFGDSSGDGVRGTSYMGGAIGFLGENITISGSISVSGCDIDNENGGNYLVGGAIGYNAGTVSANISVTARVISRLYGKVNNISGAFAGGIVGYNAGTLSGELNRTSGDVLSVAFNDYVGGIVGYNSGAITGKMTHTSTNAMYENATVYGATKVGGLVGYTSSALNISNAQNTGNIVGSVSVGGLVGYADAKCTINASTNTGSVSGTNNVGGLVGYAKGIDLSGVSNSSTINGYTNVGGLVGNIEGGAAITTSGNSGAVNGYKHLGGFVGYAKSSGNALSIEGTSTAPLVNGGNVTSTIPSGSSSANNDGGVAGFVGYLDGDSNITISHCVNNGEIHGLQFNGIAGILGYVKHGSNLIYINNCKNTALVEGGINTGGIGGRLSTNSSAVNSMVISHCYNGGEILTQDYSTGSTGNSGTTGGICGYFNATSTTAAERTAVISYCYNVGNVKIIKSTSGQAFAQNDSNKGFIGGIVGNAKSDASNPDTNGKVAIEYCYVDLTSGHSIVRYGTDMTTYINGTNLATVSATSYVIKKGTSITTGNSGSYLVYNEYTTTFDYPLVDGTQTTWENILTQNINGFRLTTNVADGYYYASLKGVGGELLTPDNLEVAGTSPYTVNAKYYVDNANGNIFVGTTEIVVNHKTETYKASPWTLDNPSLPSGYDFQINYFDTADYSGTSTESKTNAGTYYTETLVKIGDKVVGRLKDSTKGILTIEQRELTFGNTWTDGRFANQIDRTSADNFIYNGNLQGLAYNGIAINNRINTVPVIKNENGTNVNENGIFDVTYTNSDPSGYGFAYKTAGKYFRKYTLVDTHNYTIAGHANGIVEYKWTIAKNRLTVRNAWTSDPVNNNTDYYNFTFNGAAQGIVSFDPFAQQDTNIDQTKRIRPEFLEGVHYSVAYSSEGSVNVGTYTATLSILGEHAKNFEFVDGMTESYVATIPAIGSTDNIIDRKGVSVTTNAITYSWKINQFDVGNAFANKKAWFGAGTDMVVANQNTEKVNGTEFAYYYLQAAAGDSPKVIVYQNDKYIKDNFVLYVQYTTITNSVETHSLVKLAYGTDYEIADLTTAGDKHVADATVTASGTNNFVGNAVKYYVVADSDFGGNVNQANWGSESNPYVIEHELQLLRLSQIVNGGVAWNSINGADGLVANTGAQAANRTYEGCYFVVKADIKLLQSSVSGIAGFEPIGSAAYQFKAAQFAKDTNLDTVSIEYSFSDTAREYVGLFGYIDGTSIVGIDVVGVGTIRGNQYVGGIVGYANGGKINNCSFSLKSLSQDEISGSDYVGGIVGYANGTAIVSNSDRFMQSKVNGASYVGGIAGEWIVTDAEQINDKSCILTYAANIMIVGSGSYVGGIAGKLDASKCVNDLLYNAIFTNGIAGIGSDNVMSVYGTSYVGALFGAFVGNGYHDTSDGAKAKSIILVNNANAVRANVIANDKGGGRVIGGLVGYAEKVGILFGDNYVNESMVVKLDDVYVTIAKTGVYVDAKGNTSFVGGIVGVLGENATIESVRQTYEGVTVSVGTYSVTNKTQLNGKDFVGGIAGYIANTAGTYFGASAGETNNIIGNSIQFFNEGAVSGENFVGGIIGGIGVVRYNNPDLKIEYSVSGDTLLNGLLDTDENEKINIAYAPLERDAYTQNPFGKIVNVANVTGSGNYVGGLFGYVGSKTRLALVNKQMSDNTANLDNPYAYLKEKDTFAVYNGDSGDLKNAKVTIITGSRYVGGFVGFLNTGSHEFGYAVNKAKIVSTANDKAYVGGFVGYMVAGTIYGGMSVAYEQATAATNAYQGKEYVGGFVGYVVSATIRNSISTGFKFSETSVNKSGIIGNGLSFTIEGSWTIYIADDVTEKSVSGNTTKGRYLVVDSRIAIADNTAPKLARMAQMVGFNNVGGIETKFNFDVNVPPMENKIYQNNQLVFYDVSGNDHVSGNTFEIFENRNNVLTMQLSMAQADSMIVTLRAVEFSNIPDCKDSNKYNSNAQQGYKKPSASDLYSADVIHSTYNSDGKVIGVWANLYFTANGKSVVVGAYQRDGQIPTVSNKEDAGYIESFEPGSAESPYIINTQEEWNEFAHSVYSGKKYVTTSGARQYVRLTKDIVINANGHVGTDNNSLDFTNNGGYNFAGDFSQDNANSSFQGEFDGNGHTITVTFAMNQANRASVFPNASGAVFRNLTIAGNIQSASQETGANDVYKTAGYDVAGFVGKAFGSLEFYNCKNDANIIGLRNVAGIVGYYNSSNASITMTACVNTGNITSLQGTYTEGGFKDRYSYNDNIGESGVGVNNVGFTFGTGGIIGAYTGSITIESCRNTGEIIGGHNVGGIIGLHDGVSGNIATLTIKNCANTGHVLVNSGYWGADEGGLNGSKTEGVRQGIFGYAGGIVGLTGRYSILKMYASYNTGEVVAYSNIAGGLVGAVGPLYQPKGEKNKVLTGGRSSIVYCYNTGEVKVGGTFPKYTQTYDVVGREFYGGSIGGGFVGIVGDIQISQSYNAGNVWQFGIIAYGGSWQVRAGGIVGQSQPAQGGYVLFDNLYNVGTIYVRSIEDWITIIKTWYLHEEARYGSAISPYCDTEKDADRIYATQCYSINNCVSSHIPQYIENTVKKNNYSYYKGFENESSISWANSEAYDEYYRNSGVVFSWGSSKPKLVQTGLVYDTYDSLTGAMSDNGSALYMTGDNFAFSQSTSALTEDFTAINATYNSTLPIIDSPKNDGTTSHTVTYKDVSGLSWTAYPDSWLYVYGCLPQLSLFALDTQNGLSMRSVGYGKDIYGEFNKEPVDAGKKEYPYIIKDGIDLLGMQALVDSGYTFDGKYIEFANATNNLDKTITRVINMPTSSLRQDVGTTNDFMSSSTIGGNYEQKGKSYHLYTFGALCNQARNKNATFVGTDFSNWKDSNHFYSQSDGKLIGGATFATVNFLPIGRYGTDKVFKGSISGKQADGTNTEVANLRILTSGTDHAFAGLFARAESAEISYITVSGDMRAYATNADGHSAVGGIVADSSGDTIIDHCNAGSGSGSAARELKVFAYGKKSVYEYNNVKDLHTYAGGIVGVATTSFYKNKAHVYKSGTASIIRNCEVVNATVMSVKNNIGGIVGYVDGQAGAKGMNNKLEITGNTVTKAELTAIASDSTISDVGTKVGGILGYSDQYVAVIVSGCTVGTNSATKSVTIKGENAIGGIVGALPSNINEIKDCSVLQSTFIERGKWGVVENVKDASGDSFNGYGTAIGGIIGYAAFDTTDNTGMSVTTTISGNIVFNGNIIITQPTNKGTGSNANNSQDGVVRNVGGVFGDMTSGASFATGANIKVNGTITVSDTINEVRNIGGVAGRTKDVAFSGSFEVGVNIVVPKAYNVGGFIGSNSGIVNVLSDNTTIRIGAHLSGAHDVGGFVGNNRSGAILMLGANIYRSTRYEDPLSINVLDSAQISALNDNVGGIVGGNDDGATLTIVKGDIQNAGHIGVRKNADGSDTVSDAVGGIVGSNKGTLATGGGIGAYKALTINNSGTVIGRNYVGGVFGLLHGGSVAGTFTNIGDVTGEYFVGGSIGYVSYAATITALGNEDTKFENGAIAGYTASGDALTAGDTAAQGVGTVKGKAYVGGSIGIMLGKIVGNANAKVVFTSSGIVDASDVAGYLGGSIGVIAGQVDYAQFISTGELKGINAITAVGGSVGFIGAPTPLLTSSNCTEEYAIDLGGALFNRVHIKNSHFESNGASLVLTGTRVNEAKYNGDKPREDYEWGGVGGAIGIIAGVANGFDGGVNWANNTYYAQGSVTAPGVYNVGGIVGFIRANNITINNMLAYDIDVTGGSNVGGIIGFTEGEKTVIANAFAISTSDSTGKYTAEYTTPDGTKVAGLAGGIIGKAADDTDASTSYWVKGYKNADLAGTNVNDLKNTLGRYTAITETIGQTTIIFTKELIGGTDVAEPVYPTPYEYLSAYYGENDKHTVNGKTLTIADTFEYDETTQVTTYKPWDWYFTEYYKNVSTDSTVVKTQDGTWVYAKNTWAQYSTGTSQTGWYFVYANDAAGDEGNVGTVNAKHTATSSTQGGYTIVDRDFWKRIANAYTASEKEKGLNDPSNANYKLNSDIVLNADVYGNKAPLVNNLYATATAATKSGYYLYIASSGESRPTAKSDGDKFYIQINTVDVDNAKESAKLAKNVAVYYRSIAMGSALTYNGYNRYAPISLQKDIKSEPGIKDGDSAPAKKNTYAYTTALVEPQTVAKTVGTYKSNVFVYYYDDTGTAYNVGGINQGAWKIKQRTLTFNATSVNNKVYGDKDIESKVTIQNVAPNDRDAITFVLSIKGVDTPITISDLKAGKSYLAKDYQGIEITLVTASQDGSLSGADANFIAETITDKSTYKIEFNIKFTNAKKYEISTSLADGLSKTNYVMSNSNQNVEVKKRGIDVKIDSDNKSAFFDGKYTHGTTWTFSNIADEAFGDTWQSVLKAFSPLFVADIEKEGGGYNPYTSDLVGKNSLTYNKVTLQYDGLSTGRITFTGAGDVGNYYLRFSDYGQNDVNNTSNYYIKLTDGESESYAVSKNMLNITWSRTNNGTHVYDKSTIGTITASVVADHGIENLKSFVETYFTREWGRTKGETDIIVTSSNNTTATITFKTLVNAGTYTAKLTVNKQTHQDKINCSYTFKNGTTFSYEIEKRTLLVSFDYAGEKGNKATGYIYTTRHQGLNGIKVDNLITGQNGDTVGISIVVAGENVVYQYNTQSQDVSYSGTGVKTVSNISTIDVGKYHVTATLSSNANYQLSPTTDSWEIKKYSISLSGLTSSSKIYDGIPFKPTVYINNNATTNGEVPYEDDLITVNYKATSDKFGNGFVNKGEYTVSIGKGDITAKRKNTSSDTTLNYDVTANQSAKFIINPRTVTLTWETIAQFVYNTNKQGLKVSSASSDGTGSKVTLKGGGSITACQITGYAGGDEILLNLSGAITNVTDGKSTMTATIDLVSGENADGSLPSVDNYVLANATSGEFEIIPSILTINKNVGGSTTKVYDANRKVTDISGLTFVVESSNGGANGENGFFTFEGEYDNKNVGVGKTVTLKFTFTKPTSGNYIVDESELVENVIVRTIDSGSITPKELEVKLDKLRSGKATRVYNYDNTTYGGAGATYASGTSARSVVYRSGEGFVVDGFPSAEQNGTVTISAVYKEADAKRGEFDSYVNFVYGDDANGYHKGTVANKLFKTLVFSISGEYAQNYTFKVTNGKDAYGDTVGNKDKSVTVYDSRDEQNKDKRPANAGNINIEITVKSFKVEYDNASQSYANSDNTYNTDWKPVVAKNYPTGTTVTVLNGWMTDESGNPKTYNKYTVIRGRMGSKQLSAQVSGEKGMEHNYNMSNQPILTIGYFVDTTDFEVGSIASLMIASYYWYASQHADSTDFTPIVSARSEWVEIVTNDVYGTGAFGESNKPADAENCKSWDEYFAYIEDTKKVTVFLNEYENNSWGYYVVEQDTTHKPAYTSYRQTADFTGIVKQADIEILNNFFTTYTYGEDGTATATQQTWGNGGKYITNFLKPSVGNVLTALGSVFVSMGDGFGGTYNGNGYVIEYLNIYGFGGTEQNVGMFDKIGNGSVSGLHLRNVTISANGGNVGGIAGEILAGGEASSDVTNVSFHGSITVSGSGNVGGLFGKSARNIDKAIVLGTITANGGSVAGVVGSLSGTLSKVVSLMQVDASGTVAPIANGGTVNGSTYLDNAVWSKDGSGTISFVGGNGTPKSYADLMGGSISGYGKDNKYYYAGNTPNKKGDYDVIDDVPLTSIDVQNNSNPRQSMRLRDIVDVYLLMYSLSETKAKESGDINGARTYTISTTSWLVGKKHGTSETDAIVIANKQNIALLRQLRFATFVLMVDLTSYEAQSFGGAFYGTIYQNGYSNPSEWLSGSFADVTKATIVNE